MFHFFEALFFVFWIYISCTLRFNKNLKIPSIKSFLFKRKHKVISSHSPVPSFFARGLKRNVLSWNSLSNFFKIPNSFLRPSFSPLKLISIIIEIGDVETKLDLLVQNNSRGCMEEFCLSPTLRRKQGKVSSVLFYFRKMFVCIEEFFFLFCTYLLIIFFVSLDTYNRGLLWLKVG